MSFVQLLCRRKFVRCSFTALWIIFAFSIVVSVYYLTYMYDLKKPIAPSSVVSQNNTISNIVGPCVLPRLELYESNIMKLFKSEPVVECGTEKNWIFVENGTFVISHGAQEKHGHIDCSIRPLIRGNDDFNWTLSSSIEPFKNGTRIPSDLFSVMCNGADKATYNNVHLSIAFQPALHMIDPSKALLPNSVGADVLILGLDSVSRLMWMRIFPKLHKLLINEFEAVVLQGMNILGDGTPQALFPLLTGKTELELPESRKGIPGAVTLDKVPFIWKRFKDIGYITQMAEDQPRIGTFTYRLKGFSEQPTDHYSRPYYMLADNDHISKTHCKGSESHISIDLKWISDTFRMYPHKRKFMFHFLSEFTHNSRAGMYNLVDTELVHFFRELKNDGHLDNTVLIVMSDHGSRFAKVRETAQGKLEERLPYFSLMFPKWFKSKYPKAYENVVKNAKGLTTAHDLHEMLLDLINFRTTEPGDVSKRGISLFRQIPPERTCRDADIADHWCSCLNWYDVHWSDAKSTRIATEALKFINALLQPAAQYCKRVTLKVLRKVEKLKPHENVLKFKKSLDSDGRISDFSDSTQLSEVTYRIALTTAPNDGHYEISARYNAQSDTFIFDEHFISRTNKYGDDPHCIVDKFPRLVKYCLCLN